MGLLNMKTISRIAMKEILFISLCFLVGIFADKPAKVSKTGPSTLSKCIDESLICANINLRTPDDHLACNIKLIVCAEKAKKTEKDYKKKLVEIQKKYKDIIETLLTRDLEEGSTSDYDEGISPYEVQEEGGIFRGGLPWTTGSEEKEKHPPIPNKKLEENNPPNHKNQRKPGKKTFEWLPWPLAFYTTPRPNNTKEGQGQIENENIPKKDMKISEDDQIETLEDDSSKDKASGETEDDKSVTENFEGGIIAKPPAWITRDEEKGENPKVPKNRPWKIPSKHLSNKKKLSMNKKGRTGKRGKPPVQPLTTDENTGGSKGSGEDPWKNPWEEFPSGKSKIPEEDQTEEAKDGTKEDPLPDSKEDIEEKYLPVRSEIGKEEQHKQAENEEQDSKKDEKEEEEEGVKLP